MSADSGNSSTTINEKDGKPSVLVLHEADDKSELSRYSSDDKASQRIWRKLDLHLLPLVSLLYLLAFLDRSNVGNAKVAGMAKDLHLVGLRYNIAAAVFFPLYSFAEIPSNILLKLVRPSIWIPTIMVAWGLIMTMMSCVNTYQGLLVARAFLGLTEAGLFPGITFYISLWYPRHMQAKRVAIFFSAATIAGAFGGILAYAIEKLEGRAGLHGWQWIFLIEGLLTVAIAVLAFFLMHDYPETARFLSDDERAFVVNALREASHNQAKHFSSRFIWQAFSDWKSWAQLFVFIGVLVPVYALSLFMPSVIAGLGYSAANAQLLTIPPFVCGCIFTYIVGIYSDRYQRRGPFFVTFAFIGLIGYVVAYTSTTPGPGYAAAVIAAVGVFPTIAVTLSWAGGNAGGDVKRGVALALVIGIGNLGGICSSFVYNDPPRYHHGHGTMIGWLGLSIVSACVLMFTYRRLNAEKEALCKREGITPEMQDQFSDLGDESPLFRYVI